MKDRIINCLYILGVAALWVAFIVIVFCSCNSSKHLQQHSTQQDSTAIRHYDSTAGSTTRQEERVSNERIWEMLFGMQQAIDEKGRPIVNTYPTTLRLIDRSSAEKVQVKHDTVHVSHHDTVRQQLQVATVDKQSKTQVFPLWWLAAIGIAGLAIGISTRFLKIQIRK